MAKERDTGIVPARVKKTDIALIKKCAGLKGMTVNAWLNWAIKLGLRRDTKVSVGKAKDDLVSSRNYLSASLPHRHIDRA